MPISLGAIVRWKDVQFSIIQHERLLLYILIKSKKLKFSNLVKDTETITDRRAKRPQSESLETVHRSS